jgi:hypothetical protein
MLSVMPACSGVADTFGDPVLHDQGPDRPAGHAKADHSGDLMFIRVLHSGLFPQDHIRHLRKL